METKDMPAVCRVAVVAGVRIRSAFVIVAAVLFSACAPTHAIQPFATDGCSMFPDRSLLRKADWCTCCLAHDLAYWRGGTADERLKADQDLKDCVFAASGDAQLAELMHAGVRAGGGPYFLTPYRWGYGWPFGRMYEPLSADEEAQVSERRTQYLAANPGLVCPAAVQ